MYTHYTACFDRGVRLWNANALQEKARLRKELEDAGEEAPRLCEPGGEGRLRHRVSWGTLQIYVDIHIHVCLCMYVRIEAFKNMC